MSEEEKKAIEKLSANKNETTWNDTIRQIKREEITDVVVTRQKYITTVLNLIEKQQEQLQEKDKVVDLIAKELHLSNIFDCDYKHFKDNKCKLKYPDVPNEYKCKDCIIEYFTKKAREV